jgi:gamma-glutamyl-gamma-aminobutyrate hydrolase PuuD
MTKKVLVVNDGYVSNSYHRPFREFGDCTSDCELLFKDPNKINLLVFTGGADISPCLYGADVSRLTNCIPRRDIYESIAYQKAKELGLPMVGICRGAQFLCVMAGGKLCQHITGHDGAHEAEIKGGRRIRVSSTHHQMMLPPRGSIPIAWASHRLSKVYIGSGDRHLSPMPEKEWEACFFPNIRAVGMQFHPETLADNSEGFRIAAEFVNRYLFSKSSI